MKLPAMPSTAATILLAGLTALLPQAVVAADLETVTVVKRSTPELRRFDGTVEAVNRATVSAQTSGRIVELGFDVDQFVDAGEVIVRFDDTELRAALAQADAAVAEALAAREAAENEYQRMDRLYSNRTVSKATFDAAKAGFEASKAREAAASAALARAREQLNYTEVKAPYGGLVVERHVELGELANPGQPLMTGISLDQLRVTFAIPQEFAFGVRAADRAIVEKLDGSQVESTALTVYPVADAVSHTVRVRARLPDGEEGLFPGMLLRVLVETGSHDTLRVPLSALVHRGELIAVYRIDEAGTPRLQQVRPGRRYADGSVEIVSGLVVDDIIAADPAAAIELIQTAKADRSVQ